jgi:predicted Zn-dependent protease
MNRRRLLLLLSILLFAGAAAAFLEGFGIRLGPSGEEEEGFNPMDVIEMIRDTKNVLGEVSPEEEHNVGRTGAALLLGSAPLLDNPELQTYVNRIGLWVALQSERPDLPWSFGILDSNDINSFATPGGYIFITKGMLLSLRNEAELAAVLAHECGHVIARHHLVAVKKNSGIDLGSNLVSKAIKMDNKFLLDRLLSGSRELYARGLDKDDELEADKMGVVLAARAGYEPFGLHQIMLRLAAQDPEDGRLAFLFTTHPPPEQRLEALDVTIEPLSPFAEKPLLEQRFQQQLRSLR